MATSDNKKFVNGLNLHQIRKETIFRLHYRLEQIDDVLIGKHTQSATMRFENTEADGTYNNNVDRDFDVHLLVMFIS